jgi:hypothetical protein
MRTTYNPWSVLRRRLGLYLYGTADPVLNRDENLVINSTDCFQKDTPQMVNLVNVYLDHGTIMHGTKW